MFDQKGTLPFIPINAIKARTEMEPSAPIYPGEPGAELLLQGYYGY